MSDVITSLIETCVRNGANPLDYLGALLRNRSAVFANPAAWLPSNYLDTLRSAEQTLSLTHPPPILGHSGVLGVPVPE